MFPVTTRSDESTDAGGLALGAVGVNSGGALDVDASLPLGAVDSSLPDFLGPGSLILLLENISCCLDEGHRVDWFAVQAHFVVHMRASGTARIPHITNSISARDPLTNFHADF